MRYVADAATGGLPTLKASLEGLVLFAGNISMEGL